MKEVDRQDTGRKNNRRGRNDGGQMSEREQGGRMRSDRRDYSRSSSSSTKCRLITFPTISPNRPSQDCKTANNIGPLAQHPSEPATTERQLRLSRPQIKYWFRLVCTPGKNLDLEFSAHGRPKRAAAAAADGRSKRALL